MKAAVEHVQVQYAFSQRRACGLLMVAVSSCRYQARRSDEDLRERLVELAREKPRFGYRRLHVLLRRSGETVNHTWGSSFASSPPGDGRCFGDIEPELDALYAASGRPSIAPVYIFRAAVAGVLLGSLGTMAG